MKLFHRDCRTRKSGLSSAQTPTAFSATSESKVIGKLDDSKDEIVTQVNIAQRVLAQRHDGSDGKDAGTESITGAKKKKPKPTLNRELFQSNLSQSPHDDLDDSRSEGTRSAVPSECGSDSEGDGHHGHTLPPPVGNRRPGVDNNGPDIYSTQSGVSSTQEGKLLVAHHIPVDVLDRMSRELQPISISQQGMDGIDRVPVAMDMGVIVPIAPQSRSSSRPRRHSNTEDEHVTSPVSQPGSRSIHTSGPGSRMSINSPPVAVVTVSLDDDDGLEDNGDGHDRSGSSDPVAVGDVDVDVSQQKSASNFVPERVTVQLGGPSMQSPS